jgi:putative chitinase
MKSVTAANIKRFAPDADGALVQAIVDGWPAAEAAGINTPRRAQHFFAQMATETRAIQAIAESLNYKVDALVKLFSRARISEADCQRLGRVDKMQGGKRTVVRAADQETIATTIYGGAWGKKNLGNTEAGDGWRYRGSGFIQTTGRSNFRAAGHEDDPDTLRTPGAGFAAALVYWTHHNINDAADTDNVTAVRKIINPGLFGLDEAKAFRAKAKAVFIN